MLTNIISTVVGATYFILYHFFDYNEKLFNFFVAYSRGKEMYSIMNGVIGFIFVIGIIGLLTSIFKYFYNKHFPSNLFLNFLLKIIDFTRYFLGLQVFIYFAIVPIWFQSILKEIYSIGIIVIAIYSLTSLVNSIFKHKLLKSPKIGPEGKTLLPFINKIIIVVILVIGAITIFDNLGYNLSAFIAGAGIGGLAIAFAAQKSISQVFGALSILFNKPFKVGDIVTINGVTGTVKDIGLTYVTIIESKGHTVMIPNDATMSSNIENFSTRKNRKTNFILKLEYNTPTQKVEKGVEAIKKILQEYLEEKSISKYRVTFDTFGQSSLDINVVYFSLYNKSFDEYAAQKQEINYKIMKEFQKLKIEIAPPRQEVVFKNSSSNQTEKPIVRKRVTTTKKTESGEQGTE